VKQALAAWDSVSSPNLRAAFGGLKAPDRVRRRRAATWCSGSALAVRDGRPDVQRNNDSARYGDPLERHRGGRGPSYLENFFTTQFTKWDTPLGLQHTWTGSAMSQDVLRNTAASQALRCRRRGRHQRAFYGPPGWQSNYGAIMGTVRFANGTGSRWFR
jgi:hypothetical protein